MNVNNNILINTNGKLNKKLFLQLPKKIIKQLINDDCGVYTQWYLIKLIKEQLTPEELIFLLKKNPELLDLFLEYKA